MGIIQISRENFPIVLPQLPHYALSVVKGNQIIKWQVNKLISQNYTKELFASTPL